MNPLVSVVKNLKHLNGNIHLDQVLMDIKQGKYKTLVEKVRKLEKDGKSEEANKLKKTIPSFIPTGIFIGGHKKENLSDFSGILILDFDHIDNQLIDSAFNVACSISTTLACFRSPRGNGLKILVSVCTEIEFFECAFNQAAEYYQSELKLSIDKTGKDISRLCFYSYDPNLYKNLECDIFLTTPCSKVNEVIHHHVIPDISLSQDQIITFFNKAEVYTKRIFKFEEGSRNNFVFFLSCNCCRANIPIADAQTLILSKYGYDSEEVKSTVVSAYRNEQGKTTFLQKENLFSVYLLNLKKYNADIELDKRIMFETFIIKMLTFKGPFYLTMKMIQQELGIKRTRAEVIINWFIEIKFIEKVKIGYSVAKEPRQKNFYCVIPERINVVSKKMFSDNKEFVKKISPLLNELLESNPIV